MTAVSKISESEAIADGYTVIKTAADLDNIRNNLSGKYMLMNDIDLSGYANWDPIGDETNSFEGTFDGNGFKVKNLKIDKSAENYIGLFGNAYSGIIKNIGLENVDIKGNYAVGGLIGQSQADITNTYVTGKVSGKSWTGGLIGHNASSAAKSYSSARVTGEEQTGGFSGYNYGLISECYSSGSVTGINQTGGFVGENGGGIVDNSYTTGNVSGVKDVGGFIGRNNSGINACYATGRVSGTQNLGGFVGWNTEYTGIYASFWNTETTGLTIGIGVNENSDPSANITKGLTSAEMSDSKNFTDEGWSETDWWFEAGQPPKLAWQKPPKPPDPPDPPKPIGSLRLQVGANSDSNSAIFVETTFKLGNLKIDLLTAEKSVQSISDIDVILDKINEKGSDFGAVLNRLDSVLQSQTTQIENTTAAISTIMDTDIAEDSSSYVKNQILQQTSSSLLTQSQSLHKNTIMGLIK